MTLTRARRADLKTPADQLAGFIDKFEPAIGKLVYAARSAAQTPTHRHRAAGYCMTWSKGGPARSVPARPGSRTNLEPAWSTLIDCAWACRPNPDIAVREPPDGADDERALEFVRYIMRESEQY